MCVGDFAAERDRVARLRAMKSSAEFRDLCSETEILDAIGRLGELSDDPALCLECLVLTVAVERFAGIPGLRLEPLVRG